MIRTDVWAISIALVACSIATSFSVLPARAQAPAGQAPAAPAQPAQGRGGRGQAPQPPQGQAPIDLTGWWVSVVTEDWRWRMVTPPKGDYASVPMTYFWQGKQYIIVPIGWQGHPGEFVTLALNYGGQRLLRRVDGRLKLDLPQFSSNSRTPLSAPPFNPAMTRSAMTRA
jgi:hypothetical protein